MPKEIAAKSCFVICPIGKEGTATRDRSNKLLKHVLKTVFEPRGYKVERADQLSEPGMITNQIVKKILDCDILVADLTEGNPNVFYELAIRHGLKKPFIHTIDAAEGIPFDNAQVRTIQIDLTDLDSVDRAKKELIGQIDAIENGTVPESPISMAFDLEALKASGKTDEALLARLFSEVSQLRGEIREIKDRSRPVRTSKATMSLREILELLDIFGHDELVTKLKASDVRVDGQTLYVNSPFDIDTDVQLEEDLTKALKSIVGEKWRASVLPF